MKAGLLSGVSAVGAGNAVRVDGAKDHSISVQCGWTTAPTVLTIDLEGSLDGSVYFQIGTHSFSAGELTVKKALFTVLNAPVEFVRANVTTLTGGTGVSIDAIHCAPTRQ